MIFLPSMKVWIVLPAGIIRKLTLRHLFTVSELLGLQLASIQNLSFYLYLVKEARKHILAGDFLEWKNRMVKVYSERL